MSLILNGTDGLSDVDGTAATPAIRGTDTNTGIFFPAADTIAFSEGGTEVARFDSAGNFFVGGTTQNTSNGIVYSRTAAKAWVNFVGNNPATINASYNVSSVTFVSTGFYQLNFTNALTDANYSIIGNCSNNGISANLFMPSSGANKTTTSCRAESLNSNTGAGVNVNEVSVAIFR